MKNLRRKRVYTSVDEFTDTLIITESLFNPNDINPNDQIYITDFGRSDYRTIQVIKERIGENMFELQNGLFPDVQFYSHPKPITGECSFFERFVEVHPDQRILEYADRKYAGIDFPNATFDPINMFELNFCLPKDFQFNNVLDWFKENKDYLSIRAIEHHLEMPDSTLTKAVNGAQNLPNKYEERLSKFLMGLQNPKSVGKNLK